MKTFAVLALMSALLMAAQCNQPKPAPAPPAPVPTVIIPTADAAAPPAPAPSDDKCQAVLTLIRGEGCVLPNEWLDTCRNTRAHGGSFHLKCLSLAVSCEQVAACLEAAG